MSFDQNLYSLADTPLAVNAANTFNSVGISLIGGNRPYGAINLEIDLSAVVGTPTFDITVQTAPTGAAAGANWQTLASSRQMKITGNPGRFQIQLRDPILDQLRFVITNRGAATFTANGRWLADRSLTTAEA